MEREWHVLEATKLSVERFATGTAPVCTGKQQRHAGHDAQGVRDTCHTCTPTLQHDALHVVEIGTVFVRVCHVSCWADRRGGR